MSSGPKCAPSCCLPPHHCSPGVYHWYPRSGHMVTSFLRTSDERQGPSHHSALRLLLLPHISLIQEEEHQKLSPVFATVYLVEKIVLDTANIPITWYRWHDEQNKLTHRGQLLRVTSVAIVHHHVSALWIWSNSQAWVLNLLPWARRDIWPGGGSNATLFPDTTFGPNMVWWRSMPLFTPLTNLSVLLLLIGPRKGRAALIPPRWSYKEKGRGRQLSPLRRRYSVLL